MYADALRTSLPEFAKKEGFEFELFEIANRTHCWYSASPGLGSRAKLQTGAEVYSLVCELDEFRSILENS